MESNTELGGADQRTDEQSGEKSGRNGARGKAGMGRGAASGRKKARPRRGKGPKVTPGGLNPFEKFEVVEIHRSLIKNAPYNPRQITDDARERLGNNIEKVGLLTPLVWNADTGNLVSGHQRLERLDAKTGTQDYTLHVARVHLDPATEKAQNIFFNNANAQGYFDMAALETMFKEEKIDFEAAGFDLGEVYKEFGESPLVEQPEQMLELSKRIREADDRQKLIRETVKTRDDADFYLVVVFPGHDEREQFTDALDLDDNRYIDGKSLLAKLLAAQAAAGAISTTTATATAAAEMTV